MKATLPVQNLNTAGLFCEPSTLIINIQHNRDMHESIPKKGYKQLFSRILPHDVAPPEGIPTLSLQEIGIDTQIMYGSDNISCNPSSLDGMFESNVSFIPFSPAHSIIFASSEDNTAPFCFPFGHENEESGIEIRLNELFGPVLDTSGDEGMTSSDEEMLIDQCLESSSVQLNSEDSVTEYNCNILLSKSIRGPDLSGMIKNLTELIFVGRASLSSGVSVNHSAPDCTIKELLPSVFDLEYLKVRNDLTSVLQCFSFWLTLFCRPSPLGSCSWILSVAGLADLWPREFTLPVCRENSRDYITTMEC